MYTETNTNKKVMYYIPLRSHYNALWHRVSSLLAHSLSTAHPTWTDISTHCNNNSQSSGFSIKTVHHDVSLSGWRSLSFRLSIVVLSIYFSIFAANSSCFTFYFSIENQFVLIANCNWICLLVAVIRFMHIKLSYSFFCAFTVADQRWFVWKIHQPIVIVSRF